MIRVAVAGASGYIGGELLRLLLGHPHACMSAAYSGRLAGRRVDSAHPNLRGLTDLHFTEPAALAECDVLFLALPHRETMGRMAGFLRQAKLVIDLSADFRLRDPQVYHDYYGVPHEAPELLGEFIYGLPELHRDSLRTADRIAVPGCAATAAILALHPLASAGLIENPVTVHMFAGSSGAGATAGQANTHAERSGAMRVSAPLRHRHQAEITQETGLRVQMSSTAIEAVRGVQVFCRAQLSGGITERTMRAVYSEAYAGERFVRIVSYRRGLYRLPEPKILAGSNFCDVGFAVDELAGTAVLVAALDNLVKGGAGNALQSMNVRLGWPENTGLDFPGLHPA